MGLLWMRRNVTKREPTLSSQVAGVGRSWLFSPVKSGGRFSVETQTFIRVLDPRHS